MKTNESKSFWDSARDLVEESGVWEAVPRIDLGSDTFGLGNGGGWAASHLSAMNIAAGIGTLAVIGLGVKSVVTMVSWRRRLRDSETKGPAPGPQPLPILGNVLQLRSRYYETLYKYVDKPASVFWVLSTPFVVVNDEEGLRRVLGGSKGLYTKPKYFGYRSKAVKSAVQVEREKVANESLEYLNDGDTSRVALENMVTDSLETIKIAMDSLLGKLEEAFTEEEAKEGTQGSDAISFIRTAIVALNLEVLFGLTKNSSNAEDAKHISDMIGFAGTEFARRMVNPLKVFIDLPGNIRFFRDVGGLIGLGRRLCRLLDDTAQEMASKVALGTDIIAGSTSGLSWVHAWVGKVGKIGKLGKVVGLLMASTQTVPLTAVWMLHLVANDALVLTALREELHKLGVRSISDLSYEHFSSLPLADAVVKETLRLYPPFPLIQREAQAADILCGVTIPAGTPVYVVPWLVHRNPSLWSDADAFKPARFLRNAAHGDAPSDWAYIPFGRGARMCAGSKLALTELKVLLIHAALAFHLSSATAEGSKDGRFPELGMVPRGIRLSVRRREAVSRT